MPGTWCMLYSINEDEVICGEGDGNDDSRGGNGDGDDVDSVVN